MPRDHWQQKTTGQIAEFVPMFGLSWHGLQLGRSPFCRGDRL
ncbi:hypothetical protein [Laspinema palackyanum]